MNGGSQKQDANDAGWVFKPGGTTGSSVPGRPVSVAQPVQSIPQNADAIEWTASEYIAHQKHFSWYLGLAAVTIVVAVIVYLITRDVVSTGFILFAGFVLGVLAGRKPRLVAYRLDAGGLTIGQRYYPYGQFKSFSVMQQGPMAVVKFMPLKRLLPSVDAFVPPDNADAILNLLSQNLPAESRQPGAVDRLAHRIRF